MTTALVTRNVMENWKVMREQAGGRHLLEHKSSKKTRSIANDVELNKPQAKKIKKLLGK